MQLELGDRTLRRSVARSSSAKLLFRARASSTSLSFTCSSHISSLYMLVLHNKAVYFGSLHLVFHVPSVLCQRVKRGGAILHCELAGDSEITQESKPKLTMLCRSKQDAHSCCMVKRLDSADDVSRHGKRTRSLCRDRCGFIAQ